MKNLIRLVSLFLVVGISSSAFAARGRASVQYYVYPYYQPYVYYYYLPAPQVVRPKYDRRDYDTKFYDGDYKHFRTGCPSQYSNAWVGCKVPRDWSCERFEWGVLCESDRGGYCEKHCSGSYYHKAG